MLGKSRTLGFAAVFLIAPALALGGCSSAPETAPAGSSQEATVPPAIVRAPTDVAGLAKTVQDATSKITTVSFTSEVSVAGKTISGKGQQKMSGGKLDAANISQNMGEMGQLDMIIVDGKAYIKPPADMKLTTDDKPWVEVNEASSNPTIAAMWTGLKPTLETSPVDTYSNFIKATSSLTYVGPETLDGVKTNHYIVDVDPGKLPAGSQEKAQLEAAGLTSIPTEMWIDESGRPVKLTQKMAVQGQALSTSMTFSKYGSPVDIKAPSAAEISTS